jgi:hypothetical protein
MNTFYSIGFNFDMLCHTCMLRNYKSALRDGSNDATDARTAGYAMRQILRCGIVKASKFSNTTENINFVSSARIQNLISRDRTNNFEDLLIPLEIRIQIQAFRQITLLVENISSASVAFLAGYI